MPVIPKPHPNPFLTSMLGSWAEPSINPFDLAPSPFTAAAAITGRGAGYIEQAVANYVGRRYPRLWSSLPAVRFEPGIPFYNAVGLYTPSTQELLVRSGRHPKELMKTLIHELRHHWQFLRPDRQKRFGLVDFEQDAEKAASNVMRYFNQPGNWKKLTKK